MTNPTFDIDDIKYKLKTLSDTTDTEAFYNLLTRLIKSDATAYLNKLLLIRNRVKTEFNDFEHAILDDKSARINRIDYSLFEALDELEFAYLNDDCEAIIDDFISNQKPKTEVESEDISAPTETFLFPDSTQNIAIPDTKELTDAERQEYKRVLIQCQDDIAIKNYEDAYNHCNKARERIEPESAQLYEYLLLTYIKKESIESIIQEKINGDARKFDQVLLFVQRCKKYQNALPKAKCPSKTLDGNLEKIANDFALRLRIEYRKIKSDYVLYTEGSSFSKDKECVLNILLLFEKIYTRIHKIESFLTDIYFEICGAGKFQWIKLDKNNKLYNATISFNAIEKKELIERELGSIFTKDFKQTEVLPDNVFAVKVYYELWSKYMELRAKIKKKSSKSGVFNSEIEARQQIINCLESFKTAYLLFNKDKRFLNIPIKELTEGVFYWFDLGDNNNRINKTEFDAETEFKYYTTEKGDKVFTDKMDDLIQVNSAIELTEKTNAIYNEIYKKGVFNASIYERDRHVIYLCIKNWFKSYCAYPQPIVIDSIVNEITGRQSLLTWFDSAPNEFIPKKWLNPNTNELISIDVFLNELFNSSSDKTIEYYNLKSLKELIAQRFFKDLKDSYKIETINYDVLKNCKKELEIVSNCYVWHPQEDYLDFMVNDIWTERLWHWLVLDENGRLDANYDGKKNGFEPYADMEALSVKTGYAFPQYKVIELAANRFYSESFTQYQGVFDDNSINRQIVIDFIKRCKHCYFLFQNPIYIEIPIAELKGFNKFKWINTFIVFGRLNVINGKIKSFNAIDTLNEFMGIEESFKLKTI
jgi:hypothetical protein